MKEYKYPVYDLTHGEFLGIFATFDIITSYASTIFVKMGNVEKVRCEINNLIQCFNYKTYKTGILILKLDDYSENEQLEIRRFLMVETPNQKEQHKC